MSITQSSLSSSINMGPNDDGLSVTTEVRVTEPSESELLGFLGCHFNFMEGLVVERRSAERLGTPICCCRAGVNEFHVARSMFAGLATSTVERGEGAVPFDFAPLDWSGAGLTPGAVAPKVVPLAPAAASEDTAAAGDPVGSPAGGP